MLDLDEIINTAFDSREVKRALCVKLSLNNNTTTMICDLLNVSPSYISKWRIRYKAKGASALRLGYRGSESYLTAAAREDTNTWINKQEVMSVEALRDYLEQQHQVVYRSKQSYYDLLASCGMSYHKSEKCNPKYNQVQVDVRREEIKKNWSRILNK